jgi:hypothetical protein
MAHRLLKRLLVEMSVSMSACSLGGLHVLSYFLSDHSGAGAMTDWREIVEIAKDFAEKSAT